MSSRALVLAALCVGGCAAPAKQLEAPASAPQGGELAPESPDIESQKKQEPEGGPAAQPGFAQPALVTLDEAEATFDRDSRELARALSSTRDCEVAKKALDSMRRSAARICDLNGPGDPGGRCARAKGQLETATENVRRGCGS